MKNWPSEKAKTLVTFKTGKLDSNAAEPDGKYPFFTCAQETYRINKYAFDTECVLLAGNNAAGIFPLKYYKGKFNAYQRTYIIEPIDRKEVNTRYIYESFKLFLKSFEQTSTGATTKFLTMGILNNLWISKPPFPIQRKIAAVLSAYDDLIENNNRRIAFLEKMAEELYREWFVRLRFPGHEKVKIVKGVPEGWEVVPAGKYFKLVKGRSYTSEEIEDYDATENHRLFITLKNFKRGGGFRADAKKYYCGQYNDNQIVSGGSLVIAVTDMTQDRAVIGEIARIPVGSLSKGIISCDVVKIEPMNISESFLYAILRFSSYSNTLKEFANGANVLHLKPELAAKQKMIIPPKNLRDRFDNAFVPLIESMDRFNCTLENLATSRDRLLSRLMSGKIDVENMDIQFPDRMKEDTAAHA